jgi:hypothetical protein
MVPLVWKKLLCGSNLSHDKWVLDVELEITLSIFLPDHHYRGQVITSDEHHLANY